VEKYLLTIGNTIIFEEDTIGLLKINRIAQNAVAYALGSAFPYLTDKDQGWKDLLALAKDDDSIFRRSATIALGSAFPYLIEKEQAIKDLLALLKDVDKNIQKSAAYALSSAAWHYANKKDFKKASQYFSEASSVFKKGLLGHIKPELDFYFFEGFDCYYQGRALVRNLPENDPEEYVKNIKKAINFFHRSTNYLNKYGYFHGYDSPTIFYPRICLNIYSALYEYNLSYLNFDKKRIANIKEFLHDTSDNCEFACFQQGKDLIRILEKLTSSLNIRLDEFAQKKKKSKAVKKGKGGGWDAKYENYIDKQEKDFKKSLVELDNILNELDESLFKKIALIEKESLEKLQFTEPKTSWQLLYKNIYIFLLKNLG